MDKSTDPLPLSHPGLGVVAPTRQITVATIEKKKMRNTPIPSPMTLVSPFSVNPSVFTTVDIFVLGLLSYFRSRPCKAWIQISVGVPHLQLILQTTYHKTVYTRRSPWFAVSLAAVETIVRRHRCQLSRPTSGSIASAVFAPHGCKCSPRIAAILPEKLAAPPTATGAAKRCRRVLADGTGRPCRGFW